MSIYGDKLIQCLKEENLLPIPLIVNMIKPNETHTEHGSYVIFANNILFAKEKTYQESLQKRWKVFKLIYSHFDTNFFGINLQYRIIECGCDIEIFREVMSFLPQNYYGSVAHTISGLDPDHPNIEEMLKLSFDNCSYGTISRIFSEVVKKDLRMAAVWIKVRPSLAFTALLNVFS